MQVSCVFSLSHARHSVHRAVITRHRPDKLEVLIGTRKVHFTKQPSFITSIESVKIMKIDIVGGISSVSNLYETILISMVYKGD